MEARRRLRELLATSAPVFAPVCLDPLTARTLEGQGYEAAYLSGGALGFQLAVSEALLTVTEVAETARRITARSSIALIVDGGVGFGDAVHTSRTVAEIEATGAAAIELEDQVAPKRAHHHKGVEHLVSPEEMVGKLEAAVAARRDPDFLIIARTGAVRNESYEAAVERGRAYRGAGADLVMLRPDTAEQWRDAVTAIDAPLAAMGSFGSRTRAEWEELGWALVIDPFTGQVAGWLAAREASRHFLEEGASGEDEAAIGAGYEAIKQAAGMDDWYAIEERTTEKGATG